jgi:hypothetical protein
VKLRHLEGIFHGRDFSYFPPESTCPPDLPDTCWEPWEVPNDPPENSWGEIHEYELIAIYEPTEHPAFFNYINWFRGGSGNWHRQTGAALIKDHEYINKKNNADIRFFSTNISPQSSIDTEGDGIQYVEGLTEGIMRKKNLITLDYVGLEQKTKSTSKLKRTKTMTTIDGTEFITTNSGLDYIIDRGGHPESTDIERLNRPKKFNKKHADKITDFNSSAGAVIINTEDFGLDNSASFKSAKNKSKLRKLSSKECDFIYDRSSGIFYFNENSTDDGFGDGGVVALFQGAPSIHSEMVYFL